ncbi:uncharacterized protein LOC114349552 isoform X1 [Ostrinia furnacalis]|uniref:uncharacterized protein LOC114349552 isoform X1 n=1 Tax=Ostrinia furnacalis TaxID=93504 RepID=UPI001039494F|nr:uncharacterized protein LOC114349552 isoform X1 [Ostrinia furnacalis]
MKMKLIYLCLVMCGAVVSAGSKSSKRNDLKKSPRNENVMDVEDFSVYYDIETNEMIKDIMPRPWYKPGWMLRLPFTGGRCNCEGLQCTCCTGIRIQAFKFDRRTCAVLTYEPTQSLIDLEVKMNNESVFRDTFSARNPPPFCVPIPVPYLPPGLMDMCVRLFDISVVDQKLNVCMDMDTRVDKAPVLILHFDCMNMGLNGVSLSKPGSTQTHTSNQTAVEPSQLASDVYDTVIENIASSEPPMFNNSIKYI